MNHNEIPRTDLVHPDAERWGGWTWSEPRDGEHFRRCSYCGSVHPDDLAAETTWRADWADRKYGWPHKFYVDIPNQTPDRLYVVSSTYGGRGDQELGPGWVRWDDLSTEERRIVHRDGLDRESHPVAVKFGTRPNHFGKFCTIHLVDPTLDPQVKQTIERRSGLGFDFHDGRVRWFGTSGSCDCESYDCQGECCGAGNCSCTPADNRATRGGGSCLTRRKSP